MKIREGYVINKLGDEFVVVTIGEASKEFNGLIRLNGVGAFLWNKIQEGADSKEKLVQVMIESFEGLDEVTAEKDLEEFLKRIEFALDE